MSNLISHELPRAAMARRMEAGGEATETVGQGHSRLILFFLLLFVFALFAVWSRSQVLQATYGLSKLQEREAKLRSQNDRYRLEIAHLRSPGEVARAASAKLQMAPPEPGQLVMVK